MISPLDVLGLRVVGGIFRKMNGIVIFALELEFLLPNPQLSDKFLHPNDFLVGSCSSHILGLCG